MSVSPDFVALCVIGAIILANNLGLLERLGVKPQANAEAAAEIAIKDQTIERLRTERNRAREAATQLEATRSIEPVLEQLHANAALQKDVLDRLVHHNGSFAHMEASMKELVESLKLLTGFIAGIVELPQKERS